MVVSTSGRSFISPSRSARHVHRCSLLEDRQIDLAHSKALRDGRCEMICKQIHHTELPSVWEELKVSWLETSLLYLSSAATNQRQSAGV